MNRREFIGITALALAAPTSFAEPATGATGAVKFGTSDNWNEDSTFWTHIVQLEQKLGRNFASFRVNGVSDSDKTSQYDKCYDAGWHWGYVNGKPQPPGGNYKGYWQATVNGTYDSFWTPYFQARLADTRFTTANPLHISFHHEQEAVSEGGGSQAGTPADFAAAFRHVRGLMDSVNAHFSQGGNCSMVWTPDASQFSTKNSFYVGKCNPGVDYFDFLGADVYCKKTMSLSASSRFTPVHNYALSIGKAWFTGEMGVAKEKGDIFCVKYLKDLTTLLKQWGAGTAPGQVIALNFTNHNAIGGNYWMDSTTAILNQFKAMAADPFFAG